MCPGCCQGMGEHQHTARRKGGEEPLRFLGGDNLGYRVPGDGIAQVVPGVLLEADLPGDREWEDDEDTES